MIKQVTKFWRLIAVNKLLIGLSLLALVVRLYLATWPGFKYDIGSFFYWAVRLSQLPFSKFYDPKLFTDYTPGYLYVLSVLGDLKVTLAMTDSQFLYILKLPSILAEIFLGFFVYFVAKKEGLAKNLSLIIACSIFFNPGLIFNSSIWGQVDGFLTVPMVLAVYFLKTKKFILAGVLLAIAFLIKPQTVAIFPVFVLFALKNFNLKVWSKLGLSFLIVLILLSWPFFPDNPLLSLANKIISTANEYPYTALGPYNLWGTVGYWINDMTNLFWGISYQVWGELLLGSFWLITIFLFFRKNIPLFTLAALATLSFYFLPTRVHERYLYPALVFLVLSAIELKSEIILYAQDLLSLIYFINLYRVYIYYNEEELKHAQRDIFPALYNFLAGQDKILSWWATFFFVGLSIYILTRKYVKQT